MVYFLFLALSTVAWFTYRDSEREHIVRSFIIDRKYSK